MGDSSGEEYEGGEWGGIKFFFYLWSSLFGYISFLESYRYRPDLGISLLSLLHLFLQRSINFANDKESQLAKKSSPSVDSVP